MKPEYEEKCDANRANKLISKNWPFVFKNEHINNFQKACTLFAWFHFERTEWKIALKPVR